MGNEVTPPSQESIEEMINEAVDEAVENATEDAAKQSIWKKVQTSIMMFAALMISAGQWNDTKDLFTGLYEDALANFTHKLEYEQISKINVGNSLAYVQSIVGEPHVIKRSRLDKSLLFQYYTYDKYDLTLISKDERIAGYSVYPKVDDFIPVVPFSENLGSKTLKEIVSKQSRYHYDVNNLLYFIESQELDKQQMFLTLIRGYVEYAAIADTTVVDVDYRKTIAASISILEHQETFAESEQELSIALNKVKQQLFPNFYAITELDSSIIAESLLTRYEYQMFTES